MPTVNEIATYFSSLVPTEMKMDFDNVGLLVGIGDKSVSKALVALDISREVIDEAIEKDAEIILSHHPLFFELKFIRDSDPTGYKIVKMLQNGISGICLHTNLDQVESGVNDALAQVLGVSTEGYLDGPRETAEGRIYGMGLYGDLPSPCSFEDYLKTTKTALSSNGLRYYDAGKKVSRVALCGGSGGDLIETAINHGCDTMVTADIKYHQLILARELGINIIDGDHFCTENVVVPVLASMLKQGFPEVDVLISERWNQTAKFI